MGILGEGKVHISQPLDGIRICKQEQKKYFLQCIKSTNAVLKAVPESSWGRLDFCQQTESLGWSPSSDAILSLYLFLNNSW